MTRQMGSAGGTAPAARDTVATPGGASELISESTTDGGTSAIAEADWPGPATAHPATAHPATAVDITRLELRSPALDVLRAAGVVLVVPLISSGSLVGLLSLGPRRSERGYSTDDLRLLNSLAGYAAPAMRVGQLVRQQQAEAQQRERINQELKIAHLIQQQFLPKELPDLPSWHVAAFYRPARTVGGDFYDFIPLPGGRVMFVVGDVTDKGVPAALVMASTHWLLRAAAPRLISPGKVLGQWRHANNIWHNSMIRSVLQTIAAPTHMFRRDKTAT